MKYSAIITGILAASAVVLLVVLLITLGNTVIYDAQKTAFSDIGKDPSVIGVMTTEESETILPLMEELLSQSLDVVVEIDANDFEYSEKELSSYISLLSRLKTNSGKIKLSNTNVNDFIQSSSNMQISMDILNENLKKVEDLKQIVSENTGNQELINSIASEMLLLSKEIELSAESYEESSKIVINIASAYNLDTESAILALEIVKKIVAEADVASSEIAAEAGIVSSETGAGSGIVLSLSVNYILVPSVVKYGDTLTISGNLKNSNLDKIGIYVDSNLWKEISVTGKNSFSEKYTIGRLTTGNHFVSLILNGQPSGQEYFNVESSPSVLSINSAKQSNGENARLLTVIGRLNTDTERPVENATVLLYCIETGYLTSGTTDSKGIWSASAELQDGIYNIYAEFSDSSFPLESSISNVVEVNVSSPLLYYIIILAAAAVFGFFIFRFIRGINKRKQEQYNPKKKNEDYLKFVTENEETKQNSRKRMKIKITDGEMLVRIYKKTIKVIAAAEGIENIYTKTPREILRVSVKYPDKVKSFVCNYEYLHYSGVKLTVEEIEKMNTLSLEIIEAYNERIK